MTDTQQEPQVAQAAPMSVVKADAASAPTTGYVILSLDEDTGLWSREKKIEARSGEAAIREWAAETVRTDSLTFVAVPERSWKPIKVTPKVTTSLTLEEAS